MGDNGDGGEKKELKENVKKGKELGRQAIGEGYINPSLQLARRLISLGVNVTFATTVLAGRRMKNKTHQTATTPGLSFATFSDGFDDETLKPNGDLTHYFSELRRCGSESLTHLITSAANEGRPITFVIYSLLLSWAADIASTYDIPSALFFAQPATVLALYFYYFHGYGDTICSKLQDPSSYIELPGLPLLTSQDMPSFFSPSGPHAFILPPMREQAEFLGRQSQPKVLVNTFDALEADALRAIDKLKMLAIGPLIPSALLGGNDSSDASFCGDLFQVSSEDYIEWLNSKPDSSVVYISVGSICVLSDEQEDELVHALLNSGHTFLWVKRSKENNEGVKQETDEEKLKKLEEQGKMVSWCRQVEVLKHPALGCFLTHCGWNSTIESLVSGLPVVAFPQQIDQATNAKLIEDVWKTGVRVKANTEGIVEREEIRRCLDLVMGSRDGQKEEIERNAKKWKELARQAIGEGGSSDSNLKTFLWEIDLEI
uniref:Mogroside I-E synthase n=1 Tax=Siraitia grosvenorii TaxID=190515 RepID=GT752_SIRGR